MLKRTTLEAGVQRQAGDEYSEVVGVVLWLTLQSALERIEERSPHRGAVARVQLGVLSVLAASGVPARWLEALDGGSGDTRGALSELIDSSVCRLSEDGSRVMIHGLQGRVIREAWKDEPERWGRVEEEVAGLLEAVDVTAIPISDSASRRREALDLVEQLRATAGQDYSESLFSRPRTADALARALQYAAELGDPQAALSLSNAVDLLTKTLGPDHPRTLAARNNLANAYRSAGRLKEAITLYKEILADCLHVLGPDHPNTLASQVNLAGVYESAGRLDEAITLYNLTKVMRVLGPDHPDTLTSRNNLAGAYRSAGRLDEAIDLFERNLEDRERVLGPDHPDILASRDNLAEALRILGPDHPHTLTLRGNLAAAYQDADRLSEAVPLFEGASLSVVAIPAGLPPGVVGTGGGHRGSPVPQPDSQGVHPRCPVTSLPCPR
ncbi:tetratricopeptide repeat protein [Actinomyces sp. oral taxon 414]|uniref:tetratricopeptide repeat protein n=1 Tax=Actinomyces sp. oral taxon 414 TaxID=712122 RepID=UPI0006AFE488|nr:tetratricopeptide repeat protein [Actinomyces sp. oral taxon 414]